jgi:hypothetical protein
VTEPGYDELVDEIQLLRGQVASLQAVQPATRGIWVRRVAAPGAAGRLGRRLARDPELQYRIHLIAVLFWLAWFPIATWLFFAHRSFWEDVGIYLTLMFSLWANLTTDWSAMTATRAAKFAEEAASTEGPPRASE